jgi:hypothetical protein
MRTAFVVLLLLVPIVAEAQPSAPQPPGGRPDFLFGRPDGSVAVRGSWVFARAGSDIFDFVQRELTVEDKDFNTAGFATDFGIALTPRADAVIGVDVSRASVPSEYRGLQGNDFLPIEQTTSLSEANISGSIRFALTPRGREISSLAWVPRRAVPYVGAGAGMLWYRFKQTGDFVDALDPTLPIFTDIFVADGWTPSAHVFGGIDVQIYRRWFLTLDGRYLWAAGELGRDFEGFDPIDLAGFRFGAGINVLF